MKRIPYIQIGDSSLALPAFFPSVSSVKTNLTPSDYVDLLVALQFPQFLLSAYDYVNASRADQDAMIRSVKQARDTSKVVLLDSGNYESYWQRNKTWAPEQFWRACRELKPTMAFSFDGAEPDPQRSAEKIIAGLEADQQACAPIPVMPIVHATSAESPGLVAEVAKINTAPIIAVPERELGDGIRHRMRTVAAIRSALDNAAPNRALHILGTGNPLSIAALAISGADTFDGLEWCQTAVEFSTGKLSHFHHWDLLASTSPVRKLSELYEVPYAQRVLAHNLVFYAEFSDALRQYVGTEVASGAFDRILQDLRPLLRETN